MHALLGVGVIVTRPAHQASPLCRLLEQEGATTAQLPALQIVASNRGYEEAALMGSSSAFDLVIFTSANSVRFGSSLLSGERDGMLAAVGPATARALSDAGHSNVILPRDGYDSENLLKDPRVGVSGQRILLVKGVGGRDTLRQELARRGVEVVVADVYERCPAVHSTAQLTSIASQLRAGTFQIITATSVEIVANLLGLAVPEMQREFARLQWLVPSARVAAAARALGLSAALLRADSAEDHDLVAAIVRWRSSESGA